MPSGVPVAAQRTEICRYAGLLSAAKRRSPGRHRHAFRVAFKAPRRRASVPRPGPDSRGAGRISSRPNAFIAVRWQFQAFPQPPRRRSTRQSEDWRRAASPQRESRERSPGRTTPHGQSFVDDRGRRSETEIRPNDRLSITSSNCSPSAMISSTAYPEGPGSR